MRVLVTGGFGYLGSHISDSFARAGHDVAVLTNVVHPDLADFAARFEVFTADISEEGAARDACEGAELVVHAAAMNAQQCAADPRRAVAVNGWGTRNVLVVAADAGVRRVIYLSSIHVYGPIDRGGRIDESTPAAPVSDYAITKVTGEGYCQQATHRGTLEALVLRPSNGFGAPLHACADCWMLVVPDFCRRAIQEGRIVLTSAGTQQRDFLTLSDIVQGIQVLAEASEPASGGIVYDVGGGASISVRGMAEQVAEVYREEFGSEVPIVLPAGAENAPDGVPVENGIERISALGFRPKGDFREEIRRILRLLSKA
jgi:UDP-glucose 4-epimerase